MIYWTNILIQCLVPFPVFCMFFVLQNIHIKRSPNAINFMKNYFGIYVIFESWNHRKRRPTQGTRHQRTTPEPDAWWWVVLTSYVGWSST